MPIFARTLERIDETNPQKAVKIMANHIRYMQEQLEYILLNLGSENIAEIDGDLIITERATLTSDGGER